MLKKISQKDWFHAWLYIMPAFLLLSIFALYPTLQLFFDSFFEYDGVSAREFVGLGNYVGLLQSGEFWQTVGNSFIFIICTVPPGMAISLILAMLLKEHIIGKGIFRTIFFSPVVTSLVAAGLIWVWILNKDYGLVNQILTRIGYEKVPWLVKEGYAMFSVVIMTIWKDAGYNMILFLAGLNTISNTYYEAAKIDGAGPWQQFWNITWPLLVPTTFFVLITRLIFTFRTFEQIYAMTKGGPTQSTTVFVYYIWDKAFNQWQVGYASAAAILLLIIVISITFVQFKLVKNPYTS